MQPPRREYPKRSTGAGAQLFGIEQQAAGERAELDAQAGQALFVAPRPRLAGAVAVQGAAPVSSISSATTVTDFRGGGSAAGRGG